MSVEGLLTVYETDLEEEDRLTEKASAVRGVYFTMGGLTNPYGYCFAKLETIAKKSNVSRATVIKFIKDLDDAGYIERFERRRKHTRFKGSNGYKLIGRRFKPIPADKTLEDLLDCDSFYQLGVDATDKILDVVEITPKTIAATTERLSISVIELTPVLGLDFRLYSGLKSGPELKSKLCTKVKYKFYTHIKSYTRNTSQTKSTVFTPPTIKGGLASEKIDEQDFLPRNAPVVKDPIFLAGHYKGWAKTVLQRIGTNHAIDYLLPHVTTLASDPTLWAKITNTSKERKRSEAALYASIEFMGKAADSHGIDTVIELFDYALRHANGSPFDYFEKLIKDPKPKNSQTRQSFQNDAALKTGGYQESGDEEAYLRPDGSFDLMAFKQTMTDKGVRKL